MRQCWRGEQLLRRREENEQNSADWHGELPQVHCNSCPLSSTVAKLSKERGGSVVIHRNPTRETAGLLAKTLSTNPFLSTTD